MKRIMAPLIWGMVPLFLITEMSSDPRWDRLIQVWILLTILVCFGLANRTAQRVMLVFSILGVSLLVISSSGVMGFVSSFGAMAFVVAFFTVLPVLALPIRLVGYDLLMMQLIERYAVRLTNEYGFIVALAYFYGIFLNLAAVPMSYRTLQSLQARANHPDKERFIVYCLSQGFNAPMFWTPFSAILGVTIVTLELSWPHLLPKLVLISVMSLALSMLFYWPWVKRSEIVLEVKEPEGVANRDAFRGLLELIAVVFMLLFTVLILEAVLQQGLAINIVIVSIPFAFIWALLKGRAAEFWLALKQYLVHQLPTMASIFMVFLSAGFFVGALGMSGFDEQVSSALVSFIDRLPNALVYIILPWFVLMASFLGLHPLVTLVILAGSLNFQLLNLDPNLFLVAYVLGGISTFLVSPFSGTVGLLSAFMQRPYWQVVWPNIGTLLIFHASAQLVIQTIYWWGLW